VKFKQLSQKLRYKQPPIKHSKRTLGPIFSLIGHHTAHVTKISTH